MTKCKGMHLITRKHQNWLKCLLFCKIIDNK
uniref:Uncharacterized protein n=1 Tax=Siphoviridae sp. ctzXg6 TaxID=2826531 RepID=A0A8S5NDN8_9CAUD|nr:MAG TPA: hypothetical protein [Siphoviridae sp. ctzXg6]